jgi:L-amino acid N-acyltransferase YncA
VIVIGCHDHEFQWLIDRAGCDITPGFKAIKACDATGRIHGMVGYGTWTANSVFMHIALENPACLRELLKWMFRYPFEQCGRGVAFAPIRAANARSRKLTEKVGFRDAYHLRDAIAIGEDMIIYEMRRENCRWIPQEARKAA